MPSASRELARPWGCKHSRGVRFQLRSVPPFLRARCKCTGGSREPALPWRLSVFRERVEPRSTARHQEQADGGCSRARACAVRLQRNVKPEERGLSPEGPRGQGPAPGHRAPPGAGTRRATAWGVGEGFPSRVFLLINVGAICPPRPHNSPGQLQVTRQQGSGQPSAWGCQRPCHGNGRAPATWHGTRGRQGTP